jgi:hypothetical protein
LRSTDPSAFFRRSYWREPRSASWGIKGCCVFQLINICEVRSRSSLRAVSDDRRLRT